MFRDVHAGSGFGFFPLRVRDPEVKKAPDPGSGSETLGAGITLFCFLHCKLKLKFVKFKLPKQN